MLRASYAGPFDPAVGLASFSRQSLATLGREYRPNGHLQDCVGLPKVVIRHGIEPQVRISIEAWLAARPSYSLRSQRALGSPREEGDPYSWLAGLRAAPHRALDAIAGAVNPHARCHPVPHPKRARLAWDAVIDPAAPPQEAPFPLEQRRALRN